jgi:hypothetical protein
MRQWAMAWPREHGSARGCREDSESASAGATRAGVGPREHGSACGRREDSESTSAGATRAGVGPREH